MTLITNEIHMLDGFKRTVLVFAADRRLTNLDGSYGSTQQKLFQIPYLEGGISYFGLATVFPGGMCIFGRRVLFSKAVCAVYCQGALPCTFFVPNQANSASHTSCKVRVLRTRNSQPKSSGKCSPNTISPNGLFSA